MSDVGMTRRPLIPAVLAASVALAPAAAAQEPTLAFDRQCYTEYQPMQFSGSGYTPGGAVDLWFNRVGAVLGSYETTVLLTVEEAMDAMRKAQDVGYRAPGA